MTTRIRPRANTLPANRVIRPPHCLGSSPGETVIACGSLYATFAAQVRPRTTRDPRGENAKGARWRAIRRRTACPPAPAASAPNGQGGAGRLLRARPAHLRERDLLPDVLRADPAHADRAGPAGRLLARERVERRAGPRPAPGRLCGRVRGHPLDRPQDLREPPAVLGDARRAAHPLGGLGRDA